MDVEGNAELLGKRTGADAARMKPTYPSTAGLPGARTRAFQLRDRAISTLAPLGTLQWVERTYTHQRGGMTGSIYKATFANGAVNVSIYLKPDGKIEQLLITGKA